MSQLSAVLSYEGYRQAPTAVMRQHLQAVVAREKENGGVGEGRGGQKGGQRTAGGHKRQRSQAEPPPAQKRPSAAAVTARRKKQRRRTA